MAQWLSDHSIMLQEGSAVRLLSVVGDSLLCRLSFGSNAVVQWRSVEPFCIFAYPLQEWWRPPKKRLC